MRNKFILIAPLILLLRYHSAHAQWVQKLALPATETFQFISPVSDDIVWAISSSRKIYLTIDSGNTWKRYTATGFDDNVFFQQLLALSPKIAFLTSNTGFTGKGPGIVYKTIDGGHTWHKVFSHSGNCDFRLGMSTNKKGLLTVNYNTLGGNAHQSLFATHNGGNSWDSASVVDPSANYILSSVFMKGNEVWIDANDTLFHSTDFAHTWTAETLSPLQDFSRMYFQSNNYAIANTGPLIDVYLRKPPSTEWIHLGDPTGIGGALTWLFLAGDTGAFAIPLDNQKNFFSSDSCETFIPTTVDPHDAFFDMQKARQGESLWGFTLFTKKIYALFKSPQLKAEQASSEKISVTISDNILRISSSNATTENFMVHVYDVMGRELDTFKLTGNGEKNLSSLANGIYVCAVESGPSRKSFPIEIIH